MQQRDKKSPRRRLLLVAKWAVAALLVWWLWRSDLLDFDKLASIERPAALLGVLAGQVISLGVALWRWQLLMKARAIGIRPADVVQIGMISYFAVILLPATGGQDAVRMLYAHRVKPKRGADLLATILLDRFLGLLGMCVLGATFGLILLSRTRVATALVATAVALLLLLGGLTAFVVQTKPKWLRSLLQRSSKVAALVTALEAFRHDRRVLFTSLALACIAQLGNCLSMYFGFEAIGTPVSLIEACAITPLVTMTTIVPLTPLGLGVADAAAETLFGVVGANVGAEVTMLVRAATALSCLVCGLAYLLPAPRPEPSPDEQKT